MVFISILIQKFLKSEDGFDMYTYTGISGIRGWMVLICILLQEFLESENGSRSQELQTAG